jgi:hypothetical protein
LHCDGADGEEFGDEGDEGGHMFSVILNGVNVVNEAKDLVSIELRLLLKLHGILQLRFRMTTIINLWGRGSRILWRVHQRRVRRYGV